MLSPLNPAISLRSIFFILVLLFSFQPSVKANHYQGGEIWYDCLSSGSNQGKYVFHASLYGDCIGLWLGSTMTIANPLYAKYGGVSTISLSRTKINILDWYCDDSTNVSCTNTSPNGVYMENVYKSSPVVIYGVPDVNGSRFTYNTCCRPTSRNVTGNNGVFIATTMYPYYDPGTGLPDTLGSSNIGANCNDNSPRFAEKLEYHVLNSIMNEWDFSATDPDGDGIQYLMQTPWNGLSSQVSYQTGYSAQSPMPNTSHNANNIPLIYNSQGLVTFKTVGIVGTFAASFAARSYRNGQLLSEVTRDYFIEVDSMSGVKKPDLSFKNATASTYKQQYADTFMVGDQVDINILGIDTNIKTGTTYESIRLTVTPQEAFDSYDSSSLCNFNSCAYLDSNTTAWKGNGFIDTGFINVSLKWDLRCEHLWDSSQQISTNQQYKTYYFNIIAFDNACPYQSKTLKQIAITIEDSANAASQLKWMNNGLISWSAYNGGSFNNYRIYRSVAGSNNFVNIANISSVNDTIYNDTTAQTGVEYLYRVSTGTSCSPNLNAAPNLVLDVSLDSNVYVLNWNDIHQYYQAAYPADSFRIEVDSGSGFNTLGYTASTVKTYRHNSTTGCGPYFRFRVSFFNAALGLMTISNIDSARTPYIGSAQRAICQGDSMLLAGQYRTQAGVFVDSVYTASCDSIIHYNLDVNPTYAFAPTYKLCSGDSIWIVDQYYKTSGTYTYNLQTSKGCDSNIVARVNVNPVYDINLDTSLCPGHFFYSPEVRKTISEPGSYTFTHYTKRGCDSTYTLIVDDDVVDSNIVFSSGTLTAAQANATKYQWIECTTDSLIKGANSQSFSPTVNGSYACIVWVGTCRDTTVCIDFSWLGMEAYSSNTIKHYPNPFNNQLNLENPYKVLLDVRLFDVQGNMVYSGQSSNAWFKLQLNHLTEGVYFLQITGDGVMQYERVVKY
jgi:hypothetical protein